MTFEIALLLIIIVLALILFSFEWIAADVVALGVLATLAVTGLIPPQEVFLGFSNDAVIMILGLLILTAALMRTGVVELAGRAILRRVGERTEWLLPVIMVSSAVIGAFMSNTASTAFFIPVVLGVARKSRTSPSRLLMPLAFASILSSSVTLVSTSTNIVVSGLMTNYGLAPMGMFELAPVGIPILVAGLLYMYFIGQRLIPDRRQEGDEDGAGLETYLTELVVLPDSPLIDTPLGETGLSQEMDLNVIRVVRNKRRYLLPSPDLVLQADDVLLVEGKREEILGIKSMAGIDIKADVKLSDPDLESEDIRVVEAILLHRSPLINRTLKGIHFRERYGLQVLAIHRRGEIIRRKISVTPLRIGDTLLIQGHRANISTLNQNGVFRVISSLEEKPPSLRRAPVAIIGFVGALALATFGLVSFPVAMILGVLVVFLARAITPDEAYRDVEWRALILIASMLGVGRALDHTGAAEYLSNLFIGLLGSANPLWLLGGFFILTVLLTQPMSNQAAAVVVLPIAVQTAQQLGLNPRTFTMMIAVAASCSYLTPLEPACLMVYGPGRYKFADFLKVGSLLTIVIFLIALALVPMVWPLGQ